MAASKRPRLITAAALGAVMLMVLAAPAQGVRIPEGGVVPSGSTFVIHFQVHEGCEGSPTDALEVTIPESVENPIPEAVPGWVVETETATTDGQETEDADPRISLVRWTGGPLEDGQLLEFGLRLRFPDDPGATLEFPVVQRCGELERAWTGADESMPVPTVVLAERLSERDLIALTESLDALVTEVKDLRTQVGDVDAANLRARVTDSESIADEYGPMEPHHHAEETIVVLEADRAWVRWGPSRDDLPERLDLKVGLVINTPAWEWHVFEWQPGGHAEILFIYGQVDDIRPEDEGRSS